MNIAQKTEEEQSAFFEQMLAAAHGAEKAAGSERVSLDVAGCRIDLVFAGRRLLDEFLPALSHNIVDGDAAEATVVHVWDSQSTGVKPPRTPCSPAYFTDRGDIWGFNSPRFRTAFHYSEYAVNVLDLETKTAVFWIDGAESLPFWTKASPLRTILHWILQSDGAQILHAAAVGEEDGAVLITGKGGVGKSTTALTALAHGLKYVSDDYLAVRLEPSPRAYSLYCTAKLNAEDVVKFPSLADNVTNVPSSDGEKAVLQLYPKRAAQVVRSLPLRAVLTPRVVRQDDTDFEPAERRNLSHAAAFTTLSQLPYAGEDTQRFIDQMIERLPGLTIRLGQQPDRVTGAIRGLLEKDDDELSRMAQSLEPRLAERPLISVIVPVFNGAHFLAQAVDSILAQNYPSVEVIVVDDGSTDDISGAVARLPIDVRLFRQENTGPAAARNRGIRDASAALIAFLDVDDLWPAGTLQTLQETLSRDPNLAVVRGHAEVVSLDTASGKMRTIGTPATTFPNYIGAGLYRRQAFETVGLFDSTLRFSEDSDWYRRLGESGLKSERLDLTTLIVRRHGANMTGELTQTELSRTSLAAAKRALDRKRQALAGAAQSAAGASGQGQR